MTLPSRTPGNQSARSAGYRTLYAAASNSALRKLSSARIKTWLFPFRAAYKLSGRYNPLTPGASVGQKHSVGSRERGPFSRRERAGATTGEVALATGQSNGEADDHGLRWSHVRGQCSRPRKVAGRGNQHHGVLLFRRLIRAAMDSVGFTFQLHDRGAPSTTRSNNARLAERRVAEISSAQASKSVMLVIRAVEPTSLAARVDDFVP